MSLRAPCGCPPGTARLSGNGRTRAALALALATLTASGFTAPSAFADSASDVTVLPAAPRFSPRATSILNAGETGSETRLSQTVRSFIDHPRRYGSDPALVPAGHGGNWSLPLSSSALSKHA